jgi:hypothetical protein
MNIASAFVADLNQFYIETNFSAYFKEKCTYYDQAVLEITRALPSDRLLAEMEEFYQMAFASYSLVPSLTIPSGMAFGVSFKRNGQTHIVNAFGPFALQHFRDAARIDMGFDDTKHIRELSTHEFGHSFSNPFVSAMPDSVLEMTKIFFVPIKDAMANQGYLNWRSCLSEHFVRAAEVVIARNLGNQQDAADLRDHYINTRRFIYLPIIIEKLDEYNSDKQRITFQTAVTNAMDCLISRDAIHRRE